uniref:Secreted protein n=1 Tax=Zea mays TaxID=4577 RepID=A0A804PEE2_MAIZE
MALAWPVQVLVIAISSCIHRSCCLHLRITGHLSSAFFRSGDVLLFFSELLSSFPAASDMSNNVIHKNGNCVWTGCQVRICGDMRARIAEGLRRQKKKDLC